MMPVLDGPATLAAPARGPRHRRHPGRVPDREGHRFGSGAPQGAGGGGRAHQALRPHDPGARAAGRARPSLDRLLGRRLARAARARTCARRSGRMDDPSACWTSCTRRRRRAGPCRSCGAASTPSPAPGRPTASPRSRRWACEAARRCRAVGAGPGRASDLTDWREVVTPCDASSPAARRARRRTGPRAPTPSSVPLSTRLRRPGGRPRSERRSRAPSKPGGLAVRGVAGLEARPRPRWTRACRTRLVMDAAGDGCGFALVERAARAAGRRPARRSRRRLAGGFLDKVEAIHCGADGYFEKPVDWKALMRRLQHLLEREPAGAGADPVRGGRPPAGRVRAARSWSRRGYEVRGLRRPDALRGRAGRVPARPRADGHPAARRSAATTSCATCARTSATPPCPSSS